VKTVSIAFCLIFLPIASLPCFAQTPTGKAARQQPTLNERLAKPIDWGQQSVRLFTDSNLIMTFTLATSWIPGENHKGVFRYKISAFPDITNPYYSPELKEQYIRRVQDCVLFLELYDKDEFSLRTVYLLPERLVDDEAHIIGLTANSSEQMDADEYIKFAGTSIFTTGNWEMKWRCSEKP